MPKGGHREGAGRPPTYRRITLDQEAAQLLAQQLAEARQREPEEHWTATRLLSDLITEAWRRKMWHEQPHAGGGDGDEHC